MTRPFTHDTSRARLVALFLILPALAACGGEGANRGEDGAAGNGSPNAAASEAASLPVERPTGPVDEALAQRGEELFRTRGCTACHTVGEGKKVGPDLQGVVEKRDFAWLFHMVTNPDSMVKSDSTAKALLNEYLVPMADQNVQPEQFRAIYEFLRQEESK